MTDERKEVRNTGDDDAYRLKRVDAAKLAKVRAVKRVVVGMAIAVVGVWKLAALPDDASVAMVAAWLGVAAVGGGIAAFGEIMKAVGRG